MRSVCNLKEFILIATLQSKVSDFHKTISNKEAALRSLTNCRSILEKRIERLTAEKEKEKEMMTEEIKDLKDEIEARKLEVGKVVKYISSHD